MIVVLALATLVAGRAAASEETDVMSVVHQWIDAFNKGGMGLSLCADQITILDDFPPYEWHGPRACLKWLSDHDAFAKSQKITDGFLTLGKARQLYITADHAYFSASATFTFRMAGKKMKQIGSTETLTLQKGSSGWRVTGEAWASTSLAAAATGS